MIKISVTIENDLLNTGSLSFFSQQSTDFLSLLNLCQLLKTKRRSRCQSFAFDIVNHLSINLLVRAENAKTRTLSSSVNLLADTELYLNSSFNFFDCHNRKS